MRIYYISPIKHNKHTNGALCVHELLPHDAVGEGRLACAAVSDDHDLAAVPGLRALTQSGVQVLPIGMRCGLLQGV